VYDLTICGVAGEEAPLDLSSMKKKREILPRCVGRVASNAGGGVIGGKLKNRLQEGQAKGIAGVSTRKRKMLQGVLESPAFPRL